MHGILDIAGMIPIPGISVVTGALNAALYLAEGNLEEAGWALLGMVPSGKIMGKGAKLMAKGVSKYGGNLAKIGAGRTTKAFKGAGKPQGLDKPQGSGKPAGPGDEDSESACISTTR
ncbi:MAG: hypothetical protein FWG40_12485 [Peptococcaceae bacterium]|nr:hypothetical protein [Peptococcaceae bacterium]